MNKQPIELTFKQLNDRAFIESVRGLVNHKFDAFTTAYKLKKIMDKIDSESKKAGDLWQQEYNKLEMEEVAPEGAPEGTPKMKRPKDPEAFKKFQDQFLETKCEVGNRYKLHINEILGYKLSAVEMVTLEPILEGFDVLEEREEENGKAH